MRDLRCFLSMLVFAALAPAAVDPDLPPPAPVVNGVFPHGVRRGTNVTVRLSGQNLQDAKSVEFSGAGLKGEILSSLGSSVELRVTADAAAEVGLHDFRLRTPRGIYPGVFDVG